jgi:hypothetical protein
MVFSLGSSSCVEAFELWAAASRIVNLAIPLPSIGNVCIEKVDHAFSMSVATLSDYARVWRSRQSNPVGFSCPNLEYIIILQSRGSMFFLSSLSSWSLLTNQPNDGLRLPVQHGQHLGSLRCPLFLYLSLPFFGFSLYLALTYFVLHHIVVLKPFITIHHLSRHHAFCICSIVYFTPCSSISRESRSRLPPPCQPTTCTFG